MGNPWYRRNRLRHAVKRDRRLEEITRRLTNPEFVERVVSTHLGAVDPRRTTRTSIPSARNSSLREERAFSDALLKLIGSGDRIELLEPLASELCHAAKGLGYEFAAYQLILQHYRTIETVVADGIAADWVGVAQHSLATERKLRDIQADIVLERVAEVIVGDDPRFDPFIIKTLRGSRIQARAFIPVFVVRDKNGVVVEPRAKRCRWRTRRIEKEETSVKLRLEPMAPRGSTLEIIGTLEVGYTSKQAITREALLEVADLAMRAAPEIFDAMLASLLERVASSAMALAGAASATLHLFRGAPDPRRSDREFFAYSIPVGRAATIKTKGKRIGGINDPPRRAGIGAEAREDGFPRVMPDPRRGEGPETLRETNPAIYAQGVRAIAVFPLQLGGCEGLLYVHHFAQHDFDTAVVARVWKFLHAAEREIHGALMVIDAQESRRRVNALGRAFVTFFQRSEFSSGDDESKVAGKRRALHALAWHALNMMRADVILAVGFKKLGSARPSIELAPILAGKWRDERRPHADLDRLASDAYELAFQRGPTYPEDAHGATRQTLLGLFGKAEQIVSAAAVPLRDRRRVLGLVVFGFRSGRTFTRAERIIVELFGQLSSVILRDRKLKDEDVARLADNMGKAIQVAPGTFGGYLHRSSIDPVESRPKRPALVLVPRG